MISGNKCKVKDDLVNQLTALNNKLNTLSPAWLHSEQARAEVLLKEYLTKYRREPWAPGSHMLAALADDL